MATPNRIEFEYDAAHDVVIARARWTLATRADCIAWRQQWHDGLAPYSKARKPDVVIVLDEFHVLGEAVLCWGEYRADLVKNDMRISFRVNPELRVRVGILTSGVAYDAATAEAPTVADATAGILAARAARAGKPGG